MQMSSHPSVLKDLNCLVGRPFKIGVFKEEECFATNASSTVFSGMTNQEEAKDVGEDLNILVSQIWDEFP